jgi:CheY-like chemotaxis protein
MKDLLKKQTILVVDDTPENLEMLSAIFKAITPSKWQPTAKKRSKLPATRNWILDKI